jgi:hypothetical protein
VALLKLLKTASTLDSISVMQSAYTSPPSPTPQSVTPPSPAAEDCALAEGEAAAAVKAAYEELEGGGGGGERGGGEDA